MPARARPPRPPRPLAVFARLALAAAGASLLHLASPTSASVFRLGLPGVQMDLSVNFGGPGVPSSPLHGGGPGAGGNGLLSQQSIFGGSGFGGSGFSLNFGGDPSPSSPGAAWPWAGAGKDAEVDADAEALVGAGPNVVGDGLQQHSGADVEAPAAVVGAPPPDGASGEGGVGGDFGGLGGFDAWTSVDAPFVSSLVAAGAAGAAGASRASSLLAKRVFGKPPPEEGVEFNLYTRKDPSPTRVFARNASSVRDMAFDPKKKTKFIIHGYVADNKPNSGGQLIKDAILKVADVNVILVDWSAVDPRFYPTDVASTVPMVGATVAELITALAADAGVDLDDVHVIGHSLGSHIAGAAGSIALGPSGKGWITGLDPAGPLYEGAEPAGRLDPTDAAFVEAVHTDAGKLGISQPVAHTDFVVDGGKHPQPDCGNDVLGACSHCFAYEVYAFAAANQGALVGTKCDSVEDFQRGACSGSARTPLGLDPDRKSRGVFYLDSVEKPSQTLQAIGHGSVSAFVISEINRQRKPADAKPSDLVFRC